MTGQVTAGLYQIATLEVDRAKRSQITVLGYEMVDSGSDGLLGRDFLDQFQVVIDNAVGTVTLTRK